MPAITAEALGELAESTFKDLLSMWMGPAPIGRPSSIVPDRHKSDVVITLPSLLPGMGSIRTEWQIKASSIGATVVDPRTNLVCHKIDLHDGGEGLRDAALDSRLFLAFAKPTIDDYSALLSRPPQERFDWYAIDLRQYYRNHSKDSLRYIYMPIRNGLSLGTFSLLWASLWVESFRNPIQHLQLLELNPALGELLETFRLDLDRLGFESVASLQGVLGELTSSTGNAELDRAAIDRLAMLVSIRGIALDLKKGPGTERIETYSPESLTGAQNLWLFSRNYHEFMRATHMRADFNSRCLPMPGEDLDQLPRYQQATLYYVGCLYREMVNAEVLYVRRLPGVGGQDFSTWGSALGEFFWIEVDDSGTMHFSHVTRKHGEVDAEAIANAKAGTLHSGGVNLSRYGLFGGLGLGDLRLGEAPPIQFFASEDPYIEHPVELWGTRTFSRKG